MLRQLLTLTLILSFAPLAPACAAHSAAEPVTYEVSFDHAHAQVVDVRMLIPAWHEPTLEVRLPAWRPGRYEILNLAGGVRAFAASAPDGSPLPVAKSDKSTWRIQTPAPGPIRIEYSLYCNALGERTRHADDTHAYLSGAAIFLYADSLRQHPARVRLALRPGWGVATGLTPDAGEPGSFLAPDYDTLVDCPIEAGVHTTSTFQVEGVAYTIAAWGRTDALPPAFTADCEKIARAQHALFGSFPHPSYLFIAHIAPAAGGGTEHLNSTVIQFRPTVATDPKAYRGLLSLASHELFHTWNVKQFIPAGIKPYDYQRENYTPLLWIAEGTTSYYDELLCARAGVWKVADYLDSLATLIDAHQRRPGTRLQSLEDSSFDSWIKFNRPTPDAVNSTISFYDQGALASLVLDARIREATANARSLDDLMRALWHRFPRSGPAYATPDVLAILTELTGQDFAPFFASHVSGTQPLPLDDALRVLGLETHRKPPDDDPKGPAAYLGLEVRDADGLAVVSTVRADGPAHAAGIIPDDAIIALGGLRVRAADLDTRLARLTPGEPVELTVFRRDALRVFTLTPAERDRGPLKVRRVKDPTDAQRAAYESWIGQPWPSDAEKPATP